MRALSATVRSTTLLGSLAIVLGGCGSGGDVPGAHDAAGIDEATTPDLAQPEDLAGADLAGADLSTPPNGEPANLAGITAAHNMARANATPTPSPALNPLTWDATLAQAAQTVAAVCKFEHSNGSYGENLYASAGFAPTGAAVVNDWVGEAADYTYATNTCAAGKSCGHYTQVVWRTTTKLGCALKACSQNSPFGSSPNWTLVVCEYDPAGNFVGMKPY
jgi:uncharacterized protein YkwD